MVELHEALHEALRTVFWQIDGEPRQVVQPDSTAEMSYVDVSADPVAMPRELRDSLEHHFAFDTGPLVRALLLRTSAGQGRAILNVDREFAKPLMTLAREMAAVYGL